MTLIDDPESARTRSADLTESTDDSARLSLPQPLWIQWVKRTSWIVFALQFLALSAWKTFMFERFSGTLDENIYQQAIYLISRGHLNPYSTAWYRSFLQDHGSLVAWLLAPLDWIPPTGLFVLFSGVAAAVAAEIVAFKWICRIVTLKDSEFDQPWKPPMLCCLGLFVLVVNPWTLWAVSFDFHIELFGAAFIIAAAYAFVRENYRQAWLWIVLTLLCGDVTSTWLIGLALSAMVAGLFDGKRRKTLWINASLLLLTGFGGLFGIGVLGLNKGSNTSQYGYLEVASGAKSPAATGTSGVIKAVLLHPGRVVTTLLNHLQDIYANLAPVGLVGIMTPWTIGVPLVIFLENELDGAHGGFVFAGPTFQSMPIYVFGTVGLLIILTTVTVRWRSRMIATGLVTVLAVNCLIWAAIFIPNAKSTWVSVSKEQAAVLSKVDSKIPERAEVIVSQGIIARFSERRFVYGWAGHTLFPAKVNQIWFVFTPTAGIEWPELRADKILAELAKLKRVKLITAKDGVYAFRWNRPKNVHTIKFSFAPRSIGAWTAVGESGKIVTTGPESNWHVASNGSTGYVVSGDYWNERVGNYVATVQMVNPSPVFVEVWNSTANVLLARDELNSNAKTTLVKIDFELEHVVRPKSAYSGVAPFKIKLVPPLGTENQVEIRVWTPHGGPVKVFKLSVQKR